MDFMIQQLLFYFAIAMVLFLPGWFLLNLVEARRKYFSSLEKFIISVGLSIVSVDFILIIIGRAGIAINKSSVIFLIFIFILLLQLTTYVIKKSYYIIPQSRYNIIEKEAEKKDALFFSKNQTILIVLILFLTVFIKTVYLKNTIAPTATDLGHHMYWTNGIIQTGKLPLYEQTDIVKAGDQYQFSQPQKIADFIIGEHLIFAAIFLISGAGVISVFPSLILLLINIIGIGAVFILALRFWENYPWGKNAAIFTLFLSGPLYAISSSQAKFVSGGVIGNVLGNFLIPLAIYFFYRAVREKNSGFMSLAIFISAALFYTHHLSAFIFAFALIFGLAIIVIFKIKNIGNYSREWFRIIAKPPVIISLLVAGCLLLVYLPSYLETNAAETIVGAPSKSTKAGFSFSQISYITGEGRMALGIIGVLILLALRKKKPYQAAILSSWTAVIFLMSWKPQWIHLNIPSVRVANYLAFPVVIAGGFAMAWMFYHLSQQEQKKSYLPKKLLLTLFTVIFIFVTIGGLYDNAQSLSAGATHESVQTFHAAGYLSEKTSGKDVIIKDHNYISADSWMKIFFMRDYQYPLTRSLFFRYEENPSREQCTLNMISSPNSPLGQKCFNDLGVNFIVVNPAYDSAQFEKSNEFKKVYTSGDIAIYYRNN